jgi:hypothetical protein
MVQYVEMQNLFNRRLDVLDAGVTKFDNTMALGAYQVIVLLVAV